MTAVRVGAAREALREATRDLHQAVDRTMPLAAPAAGFAEYAHHLDLLQAWMERIERMLQAHGGDPVPAEAALPVGERLAKLRGDRAHESVRDVPAAAVRREALEAFRARPGDAYLWGVRYVIEGSSLGGSMLYGQLRERLAPNPLAFLQDPEGKPGPRFARFIRALDAALTDEGRVAEACAGAKDAFATLLGSAGAEDAAPL